MTYTAPTLPDSVKTEALIRLGHIEAKENVSILLAVESGSRAWGFPSPDSDNDVRFFYVRPISQYVGLYNVRDVIETPIDGLWDVNGWDLGKALRLLVAGNATVAEWLSSPLIYREFGPLPYKLRDLIKRHASPGASARHYYGLTNTCYKKDIQNAKEVVVESGGIGGSIARRHNQEIDQKKYLYAIRGALSIQWIKRYEEIPPMTLPALMSHDIMPVEVRDDINALLRRKATMGEFGNGPRIPTLDVFIEREIDWVKANGMDRTPVDPQFKAEANELLLSAFGLT